MNPLTTTATTATTATGAAITAAPDTTAALKEGPRTLGEMALNASERFTGVALHSERGGRVSKSATPSSGRSSREIARGLIALGIESGDRVAILGSTSVDWTLADYGSLCAGAIVTPIYHTNSPGGMRLRARAFRGAAGVLRGPRPGGEDHARPQPLPDLEHVVLFEGQAPDTISLGELRAQRPAVNHTAVHLRLAAIDPDDLATLVYTSGTTGPPKGCMLSHANILETTRMYVEQLGIDETHTLYQFLPLAHVLARVAQGVVIRAGARACFWSGDPTRIVDELSELHPTHFPAVPRIYEKIHSAVLGKAQDGPRIRRALFHWALNSGTRVRGGLRNGTDPGPLARLQFRLADRLVLSKIRAVFGPEHHMALVGAAPVARELLEFFDACGVLVLEGYGMTESCAAATLNTHRAARLGTVGRPLPGTEIGIADDGEILIRGPHVFKGYYKDSAATKAALTPEGWLCTGDLGAVQTADSSPSPAARRT